MITFMNSVASFVVIPDIVHTSMNHSKTQEQRKLSQFAQAVGTFIRYWGFRKIHGEIWAVIYLSKSPLAAVDIEKELEVSKALVSPALQELLEEGLIRAAPSENSKIKRYEAVEDVAGVIRGVLRRREQPMIAEAAAKLRAVQQIATAEGNIDIQRLDQLSAMIQSAEFALTAMVDSDEFWKA